MKKLLLSIIAASSMISCNTTKVASIKSGHLQGLYVRQGSSEKVELKQDGTYILYNPLQSFTPVFEQCETASKGKWSVLSNDVLELTSEDKYLKQKGFEYELKKENKLSHDSLYISVTFANDYEPNVMLNFTFNNNNSKSIETEKTLIVVPKSKHLWVKSSNSVNRNHIYFSINANVSGIHLYKSRILFKIFEEDIDTENTNYLTITLLNFDRCFFEFEPLDKELIYINNSSQLLWKGDTWKKQQ
jgi:hypothetical protein